MNELHWTRVICLKTQPQKSQKTKKNFEFFKYISEHQIGIEIKSGIKLGCAKIWQQKIGLC